MNTKQSIVEYVKLIDSQNGVWSAMGSFNIKTTDYMILQLCKMTLELSSEVERLREFAESNPGDHPAQTNTTQPATDVDRSGASQLLG